EKEIPLELQIQNNGSYLEIFSFYRRHFNFNNSQSNQYIRTTAGRVIMNKAIQEIKQHCLL
ncbi:MAG: hypothetical protein ACKOX2_16715, partial [Microcystaceae cyanobacterium]